MPANRILENQRIRVEIDAASGAFDLFDKVGGRQWDADPWHGAAGWLVLAEQSGKRRECNLSQAETIDIAVKGERSAELLFRRLNAPGLGAPIEASVSIRLSLEGESGPLRIEIPRLEHPADLAFVELEYPCRLGALRTDVDRGYAVIPCRQGCIVPSVSRAWDFPPKVAFWAWDDGPWTERGSAEMAVHAHNELSMPFFGAVKDGGALIGVFETEDDAAIRCLLNSNNQHLFNQKAAISPLARLAACSPRWLPTRSRFGYARSMIYDVLPQGDYGAVAKYYRRIARANGLAITLREKIAVNPNVESLAGAALINLDGGYPWHIDFAPFRYSWNDVRRFVDDMCSHAGLRRALLCLWIGYRQYPPDSYPFHPANGTLDELRAMVDYARSRGFQVCFYHGYPAMMDHAPNCDPARARKTREGGMASRWGRHCSAFFEEYARRNLPLSIRDSGQIADYTDILTSGSIGECWDDRHALSRSEDRRNRENTLKYINSLGLFTGSEHMKGWAAPHLAYFKNGGLGAYHWILDQFRVPLFSLVYKDCVYLFREMYPQPDESAIQDLAAGCHFQLHFNWPSYWQAGYMNTRESAKANVAFFQEANAATALDELLEHRFVEEWNGPFVTRFSGGTEMLANPTNERREVEGVAIEPDSIRIRFAGGRVFQAQAKRSWQIQVS